MKKGIESSDSIYKRELDIWSSERLKLMKENSRLQEIISKNDNEIADLSAKHSGGAEAVPLSQEMPLASVTVPVVINSLISLMVLYSILAFY